jgi:hypothetical protein
MSPRKDLLGFLAGTALLATACSAAGLHAAAGRTDTGGIGQGAPISATAGAGLAQAPTAQPPAPGAAQLLAGGDARDATVGGPGLRPGQLDHRHHDPARRGRCAGPPGRAHDTPLAAQVQAGLATVRPASVFLAWRRHQAATLAAVAPTHDSGARRIPRRSPTDPSPRRHANGPRRLDRAHGDPRRVHHPLPTRTRRTLAGRRRPVRAST